MLKRSFAPCCRADAEFLILGSLPGEESLRRQEYYAFKHNVFWRVMGEIFRFSVDLSYEDRLEALRERRVALWDVCGSAWREGSLDSNISGHTPNDVPGLLRECPGIRRIGCNGTASFTLLKRAYPELFERIEVVKLPSTSPAAASISYETKLASFRKFFE